MAGGTIYDLAHPLSVGMPQVPQLAPFVLSQANQHGNRPLPGGYTLCSEIMCSATHVGTHMDGLVHGARNGWLWDGTEVARLQRGFGGLAERGMDTVPPIIRRGILLDVAGARGVEVLGERDVISPADLAETVRWEGVAIGPGDVVLLRTGWARNWSQPERYADLERGNPGPGVDAARWLADRGIHATGSDTIAYEAQPAPMPVHGLLLAERGIYIIENLNLEALAADRVYVFAVVIAPLKIVGASGAPVRPLALPLKVLQHL